VRNYYEHLISTKRFGESVKKTQKPVFRSSAIFPVLHNSDISSKILFLSYWLKKRDIPEVSLLVTLRNNNGKVIHRRNSIINMTKSFVIEIKDLLESTQNNFTGSLELEVFSTRDMVFPYPAFVLCYYNDTSITSVHTVGRIFNDLEDFIENENRKVPEAGFDIYSNSNFEPFIAFTNGPIVNENGTVNYEIINNKSEKLKGNFSLGRIEPYATLFLKFNQHINNLSEFLNDKVGTIKISHNFEGFFPRFLAGNIQKSITYSFTHSYYDCTSCSNENDYWNLSDTRFYDSSILIPLYLQNDFYTDLVLYPNFSPSEFSLTLDFHNNDGNLIKRIPDHIFINSAEQSFTKIHFSTIIEENNISCNDVSSVNIIADWKGKRIPTRLKLGLNVGIKNKPVTLPCNICFAPNVGNPVIEKKPGTSHWAPLLNSKNSFFAITNSAPLKNYSKFAQCTMQFFREDDDDKIEKNLEISPNGIFNFNLSQENEICSFLNDKPGWVYITSDNPYIYGWYFESHSSGSVAGDHFF
jgi:hypothetical protein